MYRLVFVVDRVTPVESDPDLIFLFSIEERFDFENCFTMVKYIVRHTSPENLSFVQFDKF